MALSMVMSLLMASSRKAGRKGLLFRPDKFGTRLRVDGVSFPGVKGPSSLMKYPSPWEAPESGSV